MAHEMSGDSDRPLPEASSLGLKSAEMVADLDRVSFVHPVRLSTSRDELLTAARLFMERNYGQPGDLIKKECWYERFGILTAFVMDQFGEVSR